ncbi:hypothetical protein FA13DRAFT_1713730 [Coprinellus micaceus]|uniref:Uncharacterized protein n=1 Tax=Coprinellus micaceus TaxID=71717 RepID=A0A4Y7SVI9_COPMI|nr:hypothetical protein FA13DRAFT_1713730 [Coprinellus micaceus]
MAEWDEGATDTDPTDMAWKGEGYREDQWMGRGRRNKGVYLEEDDWRHEREIIVMFGGAVVGFDEPEERGRGKLGFSDLGYCQGGKWSLHQFEQMGRKEIPFLALGDALEDLVEEKGMAKRKFKPACSPSSLVDQKRASGTATPDFGFPAASSLRPRPGFASSSYPCKAIAPICPRPERPPRTHTRSLSAAPQFTIDTMPPQFPLALPLRYVLEVAGAPPRSRGWTRSPSVRDLDQPLLDTVVRWGALCDSRRQTGKRGGGIWEGLRGRDHDEVGDPDRTPERSSILRFLSPIVSLSHNLGLPHYRSSVQSGSVSANAPAKTSPSESTSNIPSSPTHDGPVHSKLSTETRQDVPLTKTSLRYHFPLFSLPPTVNSNLIGTGYDGVASLPRPTPASRIAIASPCASVYASKSTIPVPADGVERLGEWIIPPHAGLVSRESRARREKRGVRALSRGTPKLPKASRARQHSGSTNDIPSKSTVVSAFPDEFQLSSPPSRESRPPMPHPKNPSTINSRLRLPERNVDEHVLTRLIPIITLPTAIQSSPTTMAYDTRGSFLLSTLASRIASASPSGELHLPNVRPSRLYTSKHTIPLTIDASEREVWREPRGRSSGESKGWFGGGCKWIVTWRPAASCGTPDLPATPWTRRRSEFTDGIPSENTAAPAFPDHRSILSSIPESLPPDVKSLSSLPPTGYSHDKQSLRGKTSTHTLTPGHLASNRRLPVLFGTTAHVIPTIRPRVVDAVVVAARHWSLRRGELTEDLHARKSGVIGGMGKQEFLDQR